MAVTIYILLSTPKLNLLLELLSKREVAEIHYKEVISHHHLFQLSQER